MPTKELRAFEFREGTSDKFWVITLDGSTHSVRFGRRGTQGQQQTKEFASAEAARTSYDKLIAEKLKKGYNDTGEGSAKNSLTPAANPAPAEKKKKPAVAVPEDRNPPGLHLAPEDWLFATWRPREIRNRPPAPPFSGENGLLRFERFLNKARYDRPWNQARMPTAMTPQEGRFWLGAMLAIAEHKQAHQWARDLGDPKDLLKQAAGTDLERTPPIAQIMERLNAVENTWLDLSPAVFLPLSMLYSWDEISELIAGVVWRRIEHTAAPDELFRMQVLPFLPEADLGRLRRAIRQRFDFSKRPPRGDFREAITPLLGLHDEIVAYLKKFSTLPMRYIFGLGSAKEVRDLIATRSNAYLEPSHVRAWLAHTELEDLGTLTEAVLRLGKSHGRPTVKAFTSLVSAPVAAREFLRLVEDGKFAVEAREWFDEHPREAVEGLSAETSGSSKKAGIARAIVQSLKRKLGEQVEEAPALTASAPLAELPDGLAQAFATARRRKVKEPKWVSAPDLPPILFEAGRLSDSDAAFLVSLLATVSLAPPHPLLVALRCYATPESLDAFAESLFNRWREAGMSGKEKWALLALGALGSDRCALRIAPYVREWPGLSKHQAALWGLECLRLIGTDTALMQISLIAQKVKFQALKKAAQETMESIAEDRGLTRDELEDRITPDCGLDDRGSRIFDFGPRQFQLRIGGNLKPVVIDQDGNRRDDLPKPTAKDEDAKAQAAVSEWKLVKKQVNEVVKVQAARLEQALVTQRRWSAADFGLLLVRHPIAGALIRPLIWGVFDRSARPLASFRVSEDRTYADSRDEAFELNGEASIGLVHPAHLDDQTKARWGEVLADYELIQPFPQLSRTMHRLTAEELRGSEIVRHTEARVKPIVFAGIAKRLGYGTGRVGDGGSYFTHAKWFSAAGITAVLRNTGLSIGYHDTDPVGLEQAYFVPEKFGRGGWAEEARDKVPLREVDEVVISEILNDMAVLASRAEEQ